MVKKIHSVIIRRRRSSRRDEERKSTAACNLSTKCTSWWWWKWNGKSMKQSASWQLDSDFSSFFCHKRDMLVAASRISARVFWFSSFLLSFEVGRLSCTHIANGKDVFPPSEDRESEFELLAMMMMLIVKIERLRWWLKLFPLSNRMSVFAFWCRYIFTYVWEERMWFMRKRSWGEWHGVWAEDEKRSCCCCLLFDVTVRFMCLWLSFDGN